MLEIGTEKERNSEMKSENGRVWYKEKVEGSKIGVEWYRERENGKIERENGTSTVYV